MIIGISGLTEDAHQHKGSMGAGKDEVASILVREHNFVRVGFADPMKRFCKEILDFSDEQLWGPSSKRNEPDKRYARSPQENVHLTPRYALQRLGDEWGRDCYPDIWVSYALRMAKAIEWREGFYDERRGFSRLADYEGTESPPANVVISDVRYKNEFDGIKRAGGLLVRVRRQVETLAVPGEQLELFPTRHPSESGLLDVDDSEFDHVIVNNGTLSQLSLLVASMMARVSDRPTPPSLRK